jgi:hypothetical protein
MTSKVLARSFIVLGFLGTGVLANATELDLSSLVTADLNTYTNGYMYPVGGGSITVGGVGFLLAPISNVAGGNDTGVVQLNGDPGDWLNSFPASVSIPVSETGDKTVYTLINSSFGSAGTEIGTLTFIGSLNNYTYTLTEGSNVRDHYDGFFTNTAPDVYGSTYFGDGSVRLDAQAISLPGNLGTLESITFAAGTQYYGNGEPFLAAVTTSVSGVPEPSTWAMMAFGFAGLGLAGRLASRKAATAEA